MRHLSDKANYWLDRGYAEHCLMPMETPVRVLSSLSKAGMVERRTWHHWVLTSEGIWYVLGRKERFRKLKQLRR